MPDKIEITLLPADEHDDHVRFLDAVSQVGKHFALNETMADGHVGPCYDLLAALWGSRQRRETYFAPQVLG